MLLTVSQSNANPTSDWSWLLRLPSDSVAEEACYCGNEGPRAVGTQSGH